MVGEACLPSNAYYPRTPDYTRCSGVHVCWSEHSDSSFVYGFMILNYGFGTMTATTSTTHQDRIAPFTSFSRSWTNTSAMFFPQAIPECTAVYKPWRHSSKVNNTLASIHHNILFTSGLKYFEYPIYRMHSNRQAWANSVDPDKTQKDVASHQDLHCLPLIQQF